MASDLNQVCLEEWGGAGGEAETLLTMEEEERCGPIARLLETSWSAEKIFPRSGNNSTKQNQFYKFFQEVWLVLIILGVQSGYCPSGELTFRVGLASLISSRDRKLISGLLACVSKDEILDYCLRMVETSLKLMREKSASLGHPVLYHVVIIDMFGLNLQVRSFRTAKWGSR